MDEAKKDTLNNQPTVQYGKRSEDTLCSPATI